MKKLFLFILFFSLLPINIAGFSQSFINNTSSYSKLSAVITYERVKIDGVGWIIEYEDGIRRGAWIDADQSDY